MQHFTDGTFEFKRSLNQDDLLKPHLHVAFCSVAYAKSIKKMIHSADDRWNFESFAELDSKVNDLLKEEIKTSSAITVHLGGKRTWVLILVSANDSAFDYHTFLRKTLAPHFGTSTTTNLLFEINQLNAKDQAKHIELIASLLHLTHWHPTKFGKKAEKPEKKKTYSGQFVTLLNPKNAQLALSQGARIAEATNLVRSLAELPSNHLNPAIYKKLIADRSKKLKYKMNYLVRSDLVKLKAGAFLAVTQADNNDRGGIAHLTYKPSKKSNKKLILVGKGLCFDTGGHNIKTGSYMYTMHRDMTGSAVALAVFELLVQMKVPYEVHAMLAIAENLVSPTGYRPNDVVIAMDGTSIEVVDTDAEGRMVLADTLAYAAKQNPDMIVDFATLTGAAVRSVGTCRAAVFSNKEKLLKLAHEAGEISGERNWGFPIGLEYKDVIKSEIADILQCSASPGPDHIHAATFLSHFAGEKNPWVHVDLSCEDNKGGLGLVGSSTTGYGVRWALEFISQVM